jgi:hypothetical protein
MTTLKLSTLTHDLDLSSNNIELIEGIDEIVQKLRIRYQFFLGEWFLDERVGIPYYEKILVKSPNLSDVNSILREVAVTTPGIAEVDRFDSEFDARTRELRIDLWARSDTGEPLQFSEPFIVGGV